jgi:hypothetical protein
LPRFLVAAGSAVVILLVWRLGEYVLADVDVFAERDVLSRPVNRGNFESKGSTVASAPGAPPAQGTVQSAASTAEIHTALGLDPHPANHYKAYQLLRQCNDLVQSLEFAAHLPRDGDGAKTYDEVQRGRGLLSSDACKDLPYRNGAIRSEHARIAAEHQIPGASADHYFEGPNGNINDLLMRPTDPLVQDWFRHSTGLLVRDAEARQAEAAYLLAQIYTMGPSGFRDQYLAAKFESLGLALLERQGALTEAQRAVRRSVVQAAKSSLSVEQVAAIDAYVKEREAAAPRSPKP